MRSACGKQYEDSPVVQGLQLRRCWREDKLGNNLEVLTFFGSTLYLAGITKVPL